ncbi:hypothetical protein SAMN05443572_104178 [Myxococcus fulvus]|uniref:Uncharacterized protein n=1 Tax=Myxococcus fulvus TaxID=33 RepID=A0ABY1CEH6_MYXFU|nr:hypothetical protein SAMN05443572_104178 [Myxococcus fulvus]
MDASARVSTTLAVRSSSIAALRRTTDSDRSRPVRAWSSAFCEAPWPTRAISCVWRTSSRAWPACSIAMRVTSSTRRATRRLASTTVAPWASSRCVSVTVASTALKVRCVIVRISTSASDARSPSATPAVACSRPSCTSVTAVITASRMPDTMAAISRVERVVRSARLRISLATTPKGRPCSPACAAMMAALRASRFVWSAISWMTSTMRPISAEREPSVPISSAAFRTVSSTRYMPLTLSPTSTSPRSAVAVTARASWFVSLARLRTESMPPSTSATKFSASAAKRASSSPEDAMLASRSLIACISEVVWLAKSFTCDSDSTTCSSRSVISSSAPVVSTANTSSWCTRLPTTWRLPPMPLTECSVRSTAPPWRRAASSRLRACSLTSLLVRCRFAVTRCTCDSARRSDRMSRRTSSCPS